MDNYEPFEKSVYGILEDLEKGVTDKDTALANIVSAASELVEDELESESHCGM